MAQVVLWLAAMLTCSERHVRNLIADGRIPGVIRCGRLVRIPRGLRNDWLIEQAKGGCHAE
jgi:excisionase family DNA binding protein